MKGNAVCQWQTRSRAVHLTAGYVVERNDSDRKRRQGRLGRPGLFPAAFVGGKRGKRRPRRAAARAGCQEALTRRSDAPWRRARAGFLEAKVNHWPVRFWSSGTRPRHPISSGRAGSSRPEPTRPTTLTGFRPVPSRAVSRARKSDPRARPGLGAEHPSRGPGASCPRPPEASPPPPAHRQPVTRRAPSSRALAQSRGKTSSRRLALAAASQTVDRYLL